jgi:hypothetical protein
MTTPTSSSSSPTTAEPEKPAGPDGIAGDIEQSREQVEDSVEAPSLKPDIKARAKQRASDTRDRVTAQAASAKERGGQFVSQARRTTSDHKGMLRPALRPGVIAAALAIAAILVWRWRRNR